MLRFPFRPSALACAAALAACAGPAPVSQSAPLAPVSGAGKLAHARFVIKVPKRARHRSRYVSLATKSMTVAVTLGSKSAYSGSVDLTPSSSGCTSTPSSTNCTLSVPLPPANGYVATIATFDELGGKGNELSHGQSVAFDVVLAKSNIVSLTLSGIPASISVTSSSSGVTQTQTGGLAVYGSGKQPLLVRALDADKDAIVGPGSPSSYSATVVSGASWSVATPAPSSSNTFEVTPPGTNLSTASVKFTASYGDDTCSLPGAACSTTVSLTNDVEKLLVANYDFDDGNGGVAQYDPPFSSSSTATNEDGTEQYPYTMALSGSNVYIGNGGAVNEVGVLDLTDFSANGAFGSSALNLPHSLAVDTSGDLFVANRGTSGTGSNTLIEYEPPLGNGSKPAATIATGTAPYQVVLDSSGDAWVANEGSSSVTEYEPPYSNSSTAALTITDGISQPYALAFDGSGNLWVANYGADTVTEYKSPYTGAPAATLSATWPVALAFDASNDLFVVCSGAVEEFKPPYTGTPVSVTNGISSPYAIAIDGVGGLFVANAPTSGAGSITAYAPPYTGAPFATITNGIENPQSLLFMP